MKRILKKPKVKVPVVSSKQLMKSFASSGYTMFKSEPKTYEPQSEPVQDRSSLFIKEFNKEKRRIGL